LSADSDFAAVNGVFDHGAWIGFVFLAAAVAAAVWCSKRPRWLPAAFGVWWFLLGLAPTAVFALSEVENDHRMYLPFAGLALALCWAIGLALSRVPLRRSTLAAGAAGCAVVFTVMIWATRQRNEVWRTDESLWLDVTLKSPRNGRGLMNYGLTQMEKGDYRRALEYFERAAAFNPAYSFLEINRGIANGGLNQDAAAERHFLRAIELAPDLAESHFFYGRWLRQKNRLAAATKQLERAIEINADYMPARYLVMQAYTEQGDLQRLREVAEATLQRFPSDATAASYLAQANAAAAAAPPRTADDYVNVSLAHYRAGRYEECIQAAREALKLQPDYAVAYNNIAAAYSAMANWDAAIAAARAALNIQPAFQLALNNLAWAESQKKLQDQNRGRVRGK
jgi:tetratricopeptide (TPR) repeat protein